MSYRQQFEAIENPWEYLDAARQVPEAERPPLLDRFLVLVSQRPRAEQDALTVRGKDVWNYKMDTARDDLKKLAMVEAGEIKTAPTIHSGMDPLATGFIAEMVYNPAHEQTCSYLVYHFDRPEDQQPERVDKIRLGRTTYRPPLSTLVERGVVMVPSGFEEYGGEASLFAELEAFLARYIQLGDPGQEDVKFRRLLCCYILMTWVYDRFTVLPYLRAIGDFGSGKSRLLQAVGWLCYRAAASGGSTSVSSLFRMIDWYRGTLIFDEADFTRSEEWQEIVKILNSGYHIGFPVWRAERESEAGSFDVRVFETFGPKILATRRRFNDGALESRCLSHTMPPVSELREDIPFSLGRRFFEEAARIRNKLLLWRLRTWRSVDADEEQRIPGVEPRINQIVQPLLAIGNEQLQEVIRGVVDDHVHQVQQERRESIEGAVISTLLKHWVRRGRPKEIVMKALTEAVRDEHKLDVKDRKVGNVLDNYSVPKETRGGLTYVKMWGTDQNMPDYQTTLAQTLAKRLGVKLVDYELAIPQQSGPALPMPPSQGGGT